MKRLLVMVGLVLCVPPLALWVWWLERRTAKRGWGLSELEQSWARAAGVAAPHRIRVLRVEHIPLPVPASCADFIHDRFGLGIGAPIGLSLRYGIYLHDHSMPNPQILVHECVHTAQYERLGIFRFLWLYLCQCATEGYGGAPLECEANEVADRVLNRLGHIRA